MIDLGIGQPQLSLLPHQELRRAAEVALTGESNALLNYGPSLGDGYFRLALAEFLSSRYGSAVDASTLMATGGATQALQLVASRLARPGDVVLVEEPTYFLAQQIFEDAGLRVVGVPLGPSGLQPEVVEKALHEHQPRLLYTIPVHQNPSGVTLAAEHRRSLVHLCSELGTLLVADEVYQLLTYEGSAPPPMATYLDSESVVSIGSFSKILAPGLRLGWLQSCAGILQKLTGAGVFASGGGVNHFTGCLVREVLASGDQGRYLETLLKVYRHRVGLLDALLREHLGEKVRWRKPEGGYFFWLELVDGRDAASLLERATAAQVGYRHGSRFSTRGDFASYLRLSFAHYGDEEIARAVERLAGVLG